MSKTYKNYLKNQKLRRYNLAIRQIRDGKIVSEWVYEPYVSPVFYDYPIAVKRSEMVISGCPHCGYRSGSSYMSGGGASVWRCGSCGKGCEVWNENLTVSPFNNGEAKLIKHPLFPTPSRGRPDNVPKEGGEYFRSRGVGMDSTPGCFVCGGEKGMRNNISGYVQCKEAGERIVNKFEHGARLDYREYEPDYIQVKIGACQRHVHCLEDLSRQTDEAGGRITNKMIKTCMEIFFISEEAKRNLRQFNTDKILKSSLLIEYAIYNEKYKEDLPEDWVELGDHVKKLDVLKSIFVVKCWLDIWNMNKDSNSARFIYEQNDVKMLCQATAGRFLMTICYDAENDYDYFSILGLDSDKDHGNPGIQGCHGTIEKLSDIMCNLVDNWDKEKFIEYKGELSIC